MLKWGAAPHWLPSVVQGEPGRCRQGGAEAVGGDGLVGRAASTAGVPVPSPASAGLHLGLPLAIGLGYGGGTRASSKPVAKSREKAEGLKSSSAHLPPPPSPIRRIEGSQIHPWGV